MYDPALGRFLQTDPIGYKDEWNLYSYVGNDPVNKADPKGTDALWQTDMTTGVTTIVIPVQFTGQDATTANISAIMNRIEGLTISNPNVQIQVISTSAPINGVLNKLDFSPNYDFQMCPGTGECTNRLGGNQAHINSSLNQATDAAAHDILHFPGIDDQYVEGPRDSQGNRTNTPKAGYDNKNIMTSRQGTELQQSQIEEARKNITTKLQLCTFQPGSRICQ